MMLSKPPKALFLPLMMRLPIPLRVFSLVLAFPLLAELATAAPDFRKEVQPILETQCLRCHGAGKEKGDLRLHDKEHFLAGGSSGALVEPGEVEKSLLIDRITLPPEDDEVMPQEAEPLSPEEIAILKAWVAAGAEWPDGVRLKTRKKEVLTDAIPDEAPASIAAAAATIDQLIAVENESRNPERAELVDDLAFLRRATIDLIGRIPSVEEIEEFESWSPSDRREKLVDKLLADPRFTDRWTVFLADTLRVRSNVQGGRELMAWLHGSLRENTPWDKISFELISAGGRVTQNPAVGFILNDDADPMSMTSAVSQVFLGVRMACAQCHDHPFDDWQQKDFYEMASFFGKTIRRQSEFTNTVFTVDQEETRVMWPPERENPPQREPVAPKFPFDLVAYEEKPHFIERFEALRAKEAEKEAAVESGLDLDALIDAGPAAGGAKDEFDILSEAKKESSDLKVTSDLSKPSELRMQLAEKVTDPRNPYFARAFVNRIWAELNGRGFVEPLDNFSEYQANSHPQTLEYLGREFIASGYDIKGLIRMVMLTDTYRRGHFPSDPGPSAVDLAEKSFTVSPVRRMLSEALYDSVVLAGHLDEKKWRPGENVRTVTKQIRVPIKEEKTEEAAPANEGELAMNMTPGNAMMANNTMSAGAGYDLESSIEIDFEKVLSDSQAQEKELESMRARADAMLAEEARRKAMMEAARQRRGPMRYALKTIEETVDDNPSFNSTMRMASPAPADHFLRVFGQPSRQGLGEFRDHSPSLRQQLMMLNGKATHEASRVGTLEPLHEMLASNPPRIDEAIERVYLETLTRHPSEEEMADARMILTESSSPLSGMADLRWAIFNSHEFRFLP
ncbi:MAG: DUF1553 domain-containing protein [Verrucomicrobiales bacterium]|nr:DUF1553 domain-containing protein [Verrucomicrobiales bacterium]